MTGLGQEANATEQNQTVPESGAAAKQQFDQIKQQVLNDLLIQIQNQGLKIGNNWLIVQNGDNLWVQNFMAQQNQTAQANQSQPSGAEQNQTQPEGNQTQPIGPETGANETQPTNETEGRVQAGAAAKFLVGGKEEASASSNAAEVPAEGAGGQGQNQNATVPAGDNAGQVPQPSGGAQAPQAAVFSRYVFVAGQNVTLM